MHILKEVTKLNECNVPVCSENCPHQNLIDLAKQNFPTLEEIEELAELYKIFSDNTRLKIICALGKDELCVCDICELLSLNQSTVSHQLRILKSSKLVKYRRQGKQIFYSLDDDHVKGIIFQALDHIREDRSIIK